MSPELVREPWTAGFHVEASVAANIHCHLMVGGLRNGGAIDKLEEGVEWNKNQRTGGFLHRSGGPLVITPPNRVWMGYNAEIPAATYRSPSRLEPKRIQGVGAHRPFRQYHIKRTEWIANFAIMLVIQYVLLV